MKVFNWVHRRFLHVHPTTAYPQDSNNGVEKCVRSKADVEKHALLQYGTGHVFVDVLSDWNDGILTIGTLAVGPLDTSQCEVQDDDDRGHVDGNNNHDEIDVHDVIMHDDGDDYEHVFGDDDDDFETSPLMKVALFSHELEKVDGDDGVFNNVDLKDNNENVNKNDQCQVRRRVTLADLFSEDSDHHLVKKLKETNDAAKNVVTITKPSLHIKPTSHAKIGLDKANKFIKEELSPFKKLNKLMKRMMKKKIHPEVEGKMQKKDIGMQPSHALGIPTNHQDEANESASLLLI